MIFPKKNLNLRMLLESENHSLKRLVLPFDALRLFEGPVRQFSESNLKASKLGDLN